MRAALGGNWSWLGPLLPGDFPVSLVVIEKLQLYNVFASSVVESIPISSLLVLLVEESPFLC